MMLSPNLAQSARIKPQSTMEQVSSLQEEVFPSLRMIFRKESDQSQSTGDSGVKALVLRNFSPEFRSENGANKKHRNSYSPLDHCRFTTPKSPATSSPRPEMQVQNMAFKSKKLEGKRIAPVHYSANLQSVKISVIQFLTETIVEEEFNFLKFKCLLEKEGQDLVLTFLRNHFGFRLFEEDFNSNIISKPLSTFKERSYPLLGSSSLSASFVVNCYMYGLRMQLASETTALDDSQLLQVLHENLRPAGLDVPLEVFLEFMKRIIAFDGSLTDPEISTVICKPFENKLLSLPMQTLRKFFKSNLIKKLASTIIPSKTLEELRKNVSRNDSAYGMLPSHVGVSSACSKDLRNTQMFAKKSYF